MIVVSQQIILPWEIAILVTHNFSGTLDGLALLDQTVRTEKHDTDLASLEVHAHSLNTRGKPVTKIRVLTSVIFFLVWFHILDKLLGLDVGHTVHTGDTIPIRLKLADITMK